MRSSTHRDRIKRAVKKSGLTVSAFAEEIGVSPATLRSWMRDPATDKSARTPKPLYVREAEAIAERCHQVRCDECQ